MLKLFNELKKVVAEIDTKMISEIEITAETIHFHEILEQAIHQLKTFRDKTEVFATDNS